VSRLDDQLLAMRCCDLPVYFDTSHLTMITDNNHCYGGGYHSFYEACSGIAIKFTPWQKKIQKKRRVEIKYDTWFSPLGYNGWKW